MSPKIDQTHELPSSQAKPVSALNIGSTAKQGTTQRQHRTEMKWSAKRSALSCPCPNNTFHGFVCQCAFPWQAARHPSNFTPNQVHERNGVYLTNSPWRKLIAAIWRTC